MAEAPENLEAVSLTIDQLQVRAGQRTLLESASANFPAGKVTLIVGRSGAGKSVLLQILAGLADSTDIGVDHNGVAYDGKIAFLRDGNSLDAWQRRVGVVFQSFAIFDELSPTANVRFASDHRGRRIRTAAADATADLLDELNVPRDVPAARLSGGQRQRLAIARTLAYDPDVVLYDEPTSGLDPVTAADVAALIARTYASHPKTSIIVTHDFDSLAAIADQIYLLDPERRSLDRVEREDWPRLRQLFAVSRNPDTGAEALCPPTPQPVAPLGRSLVMAGKQLGRMLEATSRVAEQAALLPLRLLPIWRSPAWGFRFALHYLWLVAGPSAWAYMAIAGAIIGFVTMYFTFRFLPYARYTEPLLIDDLLASIGFALYRVLVPVLATILIAARSGAALASDVGGKQYGRQIDALKTFGARPTRYLLTGMLYAMLLATPLLESFAYWIAEGTSLLVFTFTHTARGPEYWRLHFHRELIQPDSWWFVGSGWLLGKTLVSAAGVTLIAFFQGIRPKASTHDVSRGITTTILWATLHVLVVQFIFSFLEF